VFLARWLLGFTAREWWDMPTKERIAYERGIREWLPKILFGTDGIDPKKSPPGKPVGLSQIPGVEIVRAA
jgi:hypothetical protein